MGRMSREDLMANAIVYTYPHGPVDIICASDKVFMAEGFEGSEDWSRPGRDRPKPAKREKGVKSEGDDMLRSMRRARANLRRIALANEFSHFITLTLDKEKIDRFDGEAITKRLGQWCSNMVKRHGMAYVLVPERHKDGAWHFHGFIRGRIDLVDSGTIRRPGHKQPQRPRSEAQRAEWLAQGGQVVYNMPQWPYGFSTALTLRGEYPAAVGYVCKYIGKQEGERPLGRWYFSGGKLAKPAKTYAALDYRDLAREYQGEAVELDIPGSKILVIHTKSNKTDRMEEDE